MLPRHLVISSRDHAVPTNHPEACMTAFDPTIKALAFDVFGTVVDWRDGIAREVAAVAAAQGIAVDAGAFADAWRAGYQPAMQRVRGGDLPWQRIDALHRLILDTLLPRFGLAALAEAERDHLNRAWHRLDPWPDALDGLARLKRRFTIAPLSNGNFSLLTNMAKRAGLPWDCVISAELFRHYKPDRETYLGAADLLGIAPAELMLVACHPGDLRAARAAGLRTGYVARPLENGPGGPMATCDPAEFDAVADDFVALDRVLAERVDR
jgi:2-haloacid dehalogenase